MPRVYPPDLQAQQSRRIRDHEDRSWDRFHRMWTAFNALYNAANARTERGRVRASVQMFLTQDQAGELLTQLLPPNETLPAPPPGDTRYTETDPRFRHSAQREMTLVSNESKAATDRLAALMVLVYQVRCSLVHGNKNPQRDRDDQLVHGACAPLIM